MGNKQSATFNTQQVLDLIFRDPSTAYKLTEFENLGKPVHEIISIYPKTAATGRDAGKTKYYLKSFVPFASGTEDVQVYVEDGKSAPEEIVRQLWVYKLLKYYDYKDDEIALEVGVQFGTGIFGPPDAPTTQGGEAVNIPMLNTAIDDAQFIDEMPVSPPATKKQPVGRGKTDYEARQKNSKRTGDRGELIVLALEKQRLIRAGKLKLAERVDHVADRDDGLGYDILSFDDDGTERTIEVKATTGPNLQTGFYISANELEKSAELPNYHLYIVFSALSKSPQVFRMKQPNLKDLGFELEPLIYLVTHSRTPL